MPSKKELIDIYHHTKEYFNIHRHTMPQSVLINDILEYNTDRPEYAINIEIVNIDSFDMAIKYVSQGLSPLVLNMASDRCPGGGSGTGAMAQEECLFRRSNCHLTHPRKFYPLKDNDSIYSPKVTIIKSSYYEMIDPVDVSLIAVAAIRNPVLNNGQYNSYDYDLMNYKIESIFTTALHYNHDSLIIGAIGCGAFRNPPGIVASIFKRYIEQYGKFFKKIGFAILVVNERDINNINTFMRVLN